MNAALRTKLANAVLANAINIVSTTLANLEYIHRDLLALQKEIGGNNSILNSPEFLERAKKVFEDSNPYNGLNLYGHKSKIPTIKFVREQIGLSLMAAKNWCDENIPGFK